VDLLYFVRERLRFVRTFYETGQRPFVEIKRSIERGEEPYVDRGNPEDADEPAFLAEWTDANLAIDVVGMASLGMLKSAFDSFLSQTVKDIAGEQGLKRVSAQKKGSWIENYKAMFFSDFGVDWGASSADLALLEQLVLTRNDFEHNFDILSDIVYQSKPHAKKYPTSRFRAKGWEHFGRLVVDGDDFDAVCSAIEELCEFISKSGAPKRS